MNDSILSGTVAKAATEPRTEQPRANLISGLRFDWLVNLLSAVFVGGLYLDGWAHNHGRVDQSFFTPWHAFFYAGFLLVAIAFSAATIINRSRGYSLALSIPAGYRLTGVGLFIFAAGGVGDMAWHLLFGVERGIEALFSPTHILLGLGIGLIVTGPLRAAWRRLDENDNWRLLAPAIASLGIFLAAITFFMMFSFPVTVQLAANGTGKSYFNDDVGKVAGMFGATLTAAALAGPLLLALRRWRLPLGAVSAILGLAIIWSRDCGLRAAANDLDGPWHGRISPGLGLSGLGGQSPAQTRTRCVGSPRPFLFSCTAATTPSSCQPRGRPGQSTCGPAPSSFRW